MNQKPQYVWDKPRLPGRARSKQAQTHPCRQANGHMRSRRETVAPPPPFMASRQTDASRHDQGGHVCSYYAFKVFLHVLQSAERLRRGRPVGTCLLTILPPCPARLCPWHCLAALCKNLQGSSMTSLACSNQLARSEREICVLKHKKDSHIMFRTNDCEKREMSLIWY